MKDKETITISIERYNRLKREIAVLKRDLAICPLITLRHYCPYRQDRQALSDAINAIYTGKPSVDSVVPLRLEIPMAKTNVDPIAPSSEASASPATL